MKTTTTFNTNSNLKPINSVSELLENKQNLYVNCENFYINKCYFGPLTDTFELIRYKGKLLVEMSQEELKPVLKEYGCCDLNELYSTFDNYFEQILVTDSISWGQSEYNFVPMVTRNCTNHIFKNNTSLEDSVEYYEFFYSI
jgi:hypothetical protein